MSEINFDSTLEALKGRCVDMHEHFPTLRRLAAECESAIEMGVRGVCSTWAIAAGLAENNKPTKRLVYLDIGPCQHVVFEASCKAAGIEVEWRRVSSLEYSIEPSCDMLMLDTLHTYKQLLSELKRHHYFVNKYIVMHDTEAPWGRRNEAEDGSEKQGLMTAVEDFLNEHEDQWRIKEHHANSHGLTVLERV